MSAATAEALQLEPLGSDKPVSQWGLAWRRLRRHKLAMIGLVTTDRYRFDSAWQPNGSLPISSTTLI